MRIKVTKEHIRRGRRGLCFACPVALALAEAIPGSQPWVTTRIELRRNGRQVFIDAPEVVLAFATAFDAGREVRPFEFELPAWVLAA